MAKVTSRTELKRQAQDAILHGVANVLGYDRPDGWEDWGDAQKDLFLGILHHEADRVARLFGYESAWGN